MEEHKFNFSEEEKHTDESVAKSKEAVKQDAKGLFASLKTFLVELLDFRQDTDREATIDAIKGDVSFKGATAWILICSIFVASVGLNANSTAVVIGAMLISPLMGPILGVGMSIAINDVDTLRKSLINLATMIVLSLLTAFLFFKFFPLSEDTSELLGRVQPDIRDVLIAFFGGLALIIARTKRGTIASVIFGVAIATALMPPLCTAGYGLAKANWEYFGGAMYLFTINTIFIALATFLVLKLLRFPMLKYANSKKRKRIGNIAMALAIVVMIPAVWTFYDVLQESKFKIDAKNYIETELTGLPSESYLKKNASYEYNPDEVSTIEITTFGTDEISEDTRAILMSRLANYAMLADAKLVINQATFKGLDNLEYMEELRSRDSLDLLSKDQKIRILEDRVRKLAILERDQIPFEQVAEELRLNYDNIEAFSYAKEIRSNYKKLDTLNVFFVRWNDSLVTAETKEKDTKKIENWLKYKLELDTIMVKEVE